MSLAGVLIPSLAFAATTKTLRDIIAQLTDYLNDILFLLMGLAIVMFVWYIINYFIKPGAERKEAGEYVMYAVIGFFVILSFWGIVNILQNTFGLKNDDNRPASWQSFNNLFPSGSGRSGDGIGNQINNGGGSDNSGDFYNNSFLNGGQ